MFEIGKSYRTRMGDEVVATITDKTRDGNYLIGHITGGSYHWTWRASDGRINNGPPDSQYDLMPGVIDEG